MKTVEFNSYFLTRATIFSRGPFQKASISAQKNRSLAFRALTLLFVIIICVSCSSTGTKKSSSSSSDTENLVYLPNEKGFAYKSTKISKKDFNKWAFANRKVLRQMILGLDDGYILQIVGHTDSSGPRLAEGPRKGNIWYSTQRAKEVYKALIRYKFPADKLGYTGVADDELFDFSNPKAQSNRRITFRVVAKK